MFFLKKRRFLTYTVQEDGNRVTRQTKKPAHTLRRYEHHLSLHGTRVREKAGTTGSILRFCYENCRNKLGWKLSMYEYIRVQKFDLFDKMKRHRRIQLSNMDLGHIYKKYFSTLGAFDLKVSKVV